MAAGPSWRASLLTIQRITMSVENLPSVPTTSGIPSKEEVSTVVSEKEEIMESQVSPNSVASIPSSASADFAAPDNPKKEVLDDARLRPKTLTEDELLGVFTLEDLPFLATILALFSWSTSAGSGQADRSSGGAVGEYRRST